MIKKNTAIIGCGQIGALYDIETDDLLLSHAKGYFVSTNTNLILVIDKDETTATKVSKKYNCNYLLDYRYIPLNKIDIISICVNTPYHFEILNYLYQQNYSGKIILEKPIVNNDDELQQLLLFNKDFLNQITVNYIRRFDKEYISVLNKLKENKFGNIRKISVNYFGEFENTAIHALNLVNFIFDVTPIIEYKDSNILILKFKETQVTFNKIDTDYLNFDITIFTTTHKIIFDELGYKLKIFKFAISNKFTNIKELTLEKEFNVLNGYILNLIDSIIKGKNLSPIQDAITDMKILQIINQYSKNSSCSK